MHKLLGKQIKKATGTDGELEVERLMELVSAAYQEADEDRERGERDRAQPGSRGSRF